MQKYITILALLVITVLITGCDQEQKRPVASTDQVFLAPDGNEVDKILVINKHSTGVLSVGKPAAEAEAFYVVNCVIEVDETVIAVALESGDGLDEFFNSFVHNVADTLDSGIPTIDRFTCITCINPDGLVGTVSTHAGTIQITESIWSWDAVATLRSFQILQSDTLLTPPEVLEILASTQKLISAVMVRG